MKEIVGKNKMNQDSFPKCLVIENVQINDKILIAEKLNEFFINIGPKLASVITDSTNSFESYVPDTQTFLS